jgi:adenylate cyclase class IV
VPAQLTITPVIDYKIVREHETLVEIYYDTPNDDEYVTQLVAKIRDIVKEVGGAQKIDAKILFSREEETAQESFLCMKGDKLKAKLNASGFNVVDTTIKDVLEGAEIFSLSEFYEKSVVFVKPNVMF